VIPTTIPLLLKLSTCIILVNSKRMGNSLSLTGLFIWSFGMAKTISRIQSTFNSIMHTKSQTSHLLCIITAEHMSHKRADHMKPCHATPNVTKRYVSTGHLTKTLKLNNAVHRHRRDPDQAFRKKKPEAIYNADTRLSPRQVRPLQYRCAFRVLLFTLETSNKHTVCTTCIQFAAYTNTQTRNMDIELFIILYLNDPSVTKKSEKRNKHNTTRTQPMPFSRVQTA